MFKKSFLPMLLCASFITSPMIAVGDLNWSTYLTSEQFGTDMFHTSEGVLGIAFSAIVMSITALTVCATYHIITNDCSSSQKDNKPSPYYPNEVIDLQVDINLHNR